MHNNIIKCVSDNYKNKKIRLSNNNLSSYYEINSISYCIDVTNYLIKVKLCYTFYCYEENRLYLLNERDTLIADGEVIGNWSNYDTYKKIEDELVGFGKGLAKYMGLKFILLKTGSNGKFNGSKICCNKCEGLILTKPLDEDILSKYQLDNELFKVTKKDYNCITSSQLGQINERVSRWIEGYRSKIREDFYCEECIKSFSIEYEKDIREYINRELVRFYNGN